MDPETKPPATAKRSKLRVVLISFVVALLIATPIVYRYVLRDMFFQPRNWGVVEEGKIYRSGQVSRFLIKKTLVENKIGAIIFMSEDKSNRPDVEAEEATSKELGIERYNYGLAGNGTGNPLRYVEALETLVRCEKEGKRVLVHCHTGAQRTGGVVALYRLLIQGRTSDEVIKELEKYGHDREDNKKMIPYLNEHMAEISAELVKRGVTPPPQGPLPKIGG